MVADDFSPAYRYVFNRYWNNAFEQRLKCNYVSVDWEECVFEIYLPVMAHSEMNMRFYRVVVKVVPEVSQEKAKELAVDLMKPMQKPAGIIESESIFIISPKQKGWIHGFRHVKLPGHLTSVIVDRNPLKAFRKMKELIMKFLESKLKGIFRKFNIQPDCNFNEIWYKKKDDFYYCNYYDNRKTRFKLYRHIRQTIKCLSRFMDWLKQKIKERNAIIDMLKKIEGFILKKQFEMITSLRRSIIRNYNNRETVKGLRLLEAYAMDAKYKKRLA